MQNDSKFANYLKKEINSKDISKTSLAVINLYFGNDEKAIELFRSISNYPMLTSRFSVQGFQEEDKNNIKLLIDIGEGLLTKGVRFNLARQRSEDATQFFEWAAEDCYMPEEAVKDIENHPEFDYDTVATGYLWRGYALLMLGNYAEACKLLKQVPYYFNKYKLSGGEVWQEHEPRLVKALQPLCEFKLSPSLAGREKARQGLEDFIKSYKENKYRLEGYLYYFHLKEMFPEVYSDQYDVSNLPIKPAKEAEAKGVTPELTAEAREMGEVVISDVKGICILDGLGSEKDLVNYVKKVSHPGRYPLLSSLMDVYRVTDTEGLEAEPLVEECERLLADPTADEWLKKKTRHILNVAEDAVVEGSAVMLYYEPELAPDKD